MENLNLSESKKNQKTEGSYVNKRRVDFNQPPDRSYGYKQEVRILGLFFGLDCLEPNCWTFIGVCFRQKGDWISLRCPEVSKTYSRN
jgi:hypothetical protein